MEKETKVKSKKIWKKILWIILIIFIIFVIWTARKMIIISSLNNKLENYANSNNYYTKVTSFQGDALNSSEIYYKDGKSVINMTVVSENDIRKMKIYNNGTSSNVYIEANGEKIAQLDSELLIQLNIVNYLYSENIGQLLLQSVIFSIDSEKCNGKECYYITNPFTEDDFGIYLEKDTGLIVRIDGGTVTDTNTGIETDMVVDRIYKFNTVTDEIFIEPDLTEYTIKEN